MEMLLISYWVLLMHADHTADNNGGNVFNFRSDG